MAPIQSKTMPNPYDLPDDLRRDLEMTSENTSASSESYVPRGVVTQDIAMGEKVTIDELHSAAWNAANENALQAHSQVEAARSDKELKAVIEYLSSAGSRLDVFRKKASSN
jgi:hypothetical protein